MPPYSNSQYDINNGNNNRRLIYRTLCERHLIAPYYYFLFARYESRYL